MAESSTGFQTNSPRTSARSLASKLPAAAIAGRASDLGDCIVDLRKNYRFGDQSGIYQLSRAVNDGDSEKALAVLRESGGSAGSQVPWQPLPAPAALKAALKPMVHARYRDYLQAGTPTEALNALGRFRILCALRSGPMAWKLEPPG